MIRCVTCGIDQYDDITKHTLKDFSNVARECTQARTIRLIAPTNSCLDLTYLCQYANIDWFCSPVNVNQKSLEFAYNRIRDCKIAFVSLLMPDNLSFDLLMDVGSLIKKVAMLGDGSHNFRVGASFGTAVNTPFFPFTYHSGPPGFSIGCELVPFFSLLRDDVDNGVKLIAKELSAVQDKGFEIQSRTGLHFNGIDASLAPYPDEQNSVMKLLSELGLGKFGCHGTVFLTGFLTNVIRKAVSLSKIRSVGFNGVMYSVLEDRHIDDSPLNVYVLQMASCVCGCGIDMVPLPGDVTEKEIASIMLDLYTLSTKLHKPLGIRVLPIPGKCVGDKTEFAGNDYICNTTIKELWPGAEIEILDTIGCNVSI